MMLADMINTTTQTTLSQYRIVSSFSNLLERYRLDHFTQHGTRFQTHATNYTPDNRRMLKSPKNRSFENMKQQRHYLLIFNKYSNISCLKGSLPQTKGCKTKKRKDVEICKP